MSGQRVRSKAGRKKNEQMTGRASAVNTAEDPRLEAAQTRLRESANRTDALEAMREIVTNLLGCEEIALFAVEQGNSRLLWSFGIDPQQHRTLDVFRQPALQRVLQGEFHIEQIAHAEPEHSNPPVRVFVPIRRNGSTVAVLVMLKLLPQKVGFDEADLKLVKILSEETGRALFDRTMSAGA
jgi:hypothetical protein